MNTYVLLYRNKSDYSKCPTSAFNDLDHLIAESMDYDCDCRTRHQKKMNEGDRPEGEILIIWKVLIVKYFVSQPRPALLWR